MQQSLFLSDKVSLNLLPFAGEIRLYPDFFSKELADRIFAALQTNLAWKQEPIWMFGKQVMQPRLTALYGNPAQPYAYSGIAMHPLTWTPVLEEVRDKIQSITNMEFTHVLCNYYRDGQDSMGWHRDNEPVLGKNPTIASVTFGATRVFQVRHYETKNHKLDISLTHGSLLIMSGESQHCWEHQLPKIKKLPNSRINLTFRKLFN